MLLFLSSLVFAQDNSYSDIQFINQVMDEAELKKPSEEKLQKIIQEYLVYESKKYVTEMGLPHPKLIINKDFISDIGKDSKKIASEIVDSSRLDRVTTTANLLKTNTTKIEIQKRVSKHLEFGFSIPTIEEVAKPSLQSQATIDANLYGLKISLDNGYMSNDADFIAPKITIDDYGSEGSNNGVVDAGEWVVMNIPLYNNSDDWWFSTFVDVSTNSECAWAMPISKQLEELSPPGTTTKEKPILDENGKPKTKKVTVVEKVGQTLPLMMYISKDCSHNKKIPITIVVKDTYNAPSGTTAEVGITVQNLSEARLTDVVKNVDMPKKSPKEKNILQTNTEMEIFYSTTVDSKANDVSSTIQIDNRLVSTIERAALTGLAAPGAEPDPKNIVAVVGGEYRGEMKSKTPNKYQSTDDLDILIKGSKETVESTLDATAEKLNWTKAEHANLLLAVDIIVEVSSPEPTRTIFNEEKVKNVKKDVQEADPVSPETMNAIIMKYISLSPVSVSTESESILVEEKVTVLDEEKNKVSTEIKVSSRALEPVDAVSTTKIQVNFDKEGFTREYSELIADTVTETVDEKIVRKKEIIENILTYSYRNYISIPVDWEPEALTESSDDECSDRVDNNGNGSIDCKDPSCSSSAVCIPENTEEMCKDELDNDKDGLVDCSDDDCFIIDYCIPTEDTSRLCNDGEDNDDDGLVDCDDPDCADFNICNPTEDNNRLCKDGEDNDDDGLVDCDDPDCADTSACVEKTHRLFVSAGLGYRDVTFNNETDDAAYTHAFNSLPSGTLSASYHFHRGFGIYGNIIASPTLHDFTDENELSWRTLYPNMSVGGGIAWNLALMNDKLHLMPNAGIQFHVPTGVYSGTSTMLGSNLLFMINSNLGLYANVQSLTNTYLTIPETEINLEGTASSIQFLTGVTFQKKYSK
jgi:hypothetical protein